MQTLTRQLVTLDMLSVELAECVAGKPSAVVSEAYLGLLRQTRQVIEKLNLSGAEYTEVGFANAMAQSGAQIQFKNKRIVMIYLRLLGFVIEYYEVMQRIYAIRDSHFDASSEKRLQLLQPKAIKAKSQFKTVVQALGQRDYKQFLTFSALPVAQWDWQALRLEN